LSAIALVENLLYFRYMAKGVNKETGRSHRRIDRAGTRNGRLVFVREVGISKHKKPIWLAICDCGSEVKTQQPHKTKSCGCLRSELAAQRASARRVLSDKEREESAKRNAARQREKRKNCPVRNMQARLSRLHRHALSQIGAIKKSPTFESLGYSVDEFVTHIERQFKDGMSWKNMSEWQIDHIIPISSAKTEDDVVALNQLSNLRPMWAADNNKKKDKREVLL
jgi:hypothetical protein